MGKNPKKRNLKGKGSNRKYQTIDDVDERPSSGKGNKNNRSSNRQKNKSNYDSYDDYNKLKKTLEVDGLEIVDMDPDGNCLFRSLSDQLFGDCGKSHYIVRSSVCDFMEQNEDDFRLFLVFEDEDDDGQDEEDARDFEHYIDNMRRDGEWGGNLEVVAAARLFRRSVTVYSETMAAFTIDHGAKKSMGSDMLVSYHDNDHYNSVRNKLHPPKPSEVIIPPKDRRMIQNNGHKSQEQPEVDTVINALSKSCISEKNNVVAVQKNVKRSAPCPCGSGLRYKKCCLAKQKQAKRLDRIKANRTIEEEGFSDGSDDRGETQEIFRVVAI